ncbi:Ig-like domain-containing protein [Streptomyces sp. NPDC089919]|uniref:L,D-transpeptidase n=1 Tax=Streptomyces sp. NPDC089919 TaxID=3155188 RepID=UPI0034475850
MNVQPISGESRTRRGRARTALSALALGAVLMVATACSGGTPAPAGDDAKGGGSGSAKGAAAGSEASQAVLSITPADGAKEVATSGVLKISAANGKLTTVTVADTKGNAVAGKLAADGTSWEPERNLGSATEYKVHAIAKDGAGRESAKDITFTTLTPKNTFVGHYTPENGSVVGVGMPVSIKFSRGITHPEAVEKAVTVTADPAVRVEGHWFGNDRLDFRPEKYWAPGTKVTLKLNLDGVEGRPGVYGKQTRTVRFTIGRSQVSTVDAATHHMTVVRNGAVLKKLPITAGGPATTTYNGEMVISEKYEVTRMNGATVGFGGEYDIEDVPHAMRLSDSGTFVHGNYWAASSTFGSENVSHGCVGLRDVRGAYDKTTPAAWFFDSSIIGDVVVVKNSKDKQIAPENGLNGWNMPWSEWVS